MKIAVVVLLLSASWCDCAMKSAQGSETGARPKQKMSPRHHPYTKPQGDDAPKDSERLVTHQPANEFKRHVLKGGPKYRCSPISGRDPDGGYEHQWLEAVYRNVEVVDHAPPAGNVIHFEAAEYPRISATRGHLPPNFGNRATYYIYRSPMSPLGNLVADLIDMVRLPYQYASSLREECEVFWRDNYEFFVLENVGPLGESLMVPIRNDTVSNLQYVYLPYYDYGDVLFLDQTWIIRKFVEQLEQAPNPEYGFMTVTEAQFNAHRVPMNAFSSLAHHAPRFQVTERVPPQVRNHLLLSIAWLPAVCLNPLRTARWLLKDVCNSDRWMVHGLWVDGYRGRQETSDLHFTRLREDTDFQMEPNMRSKWGAVYASPTDLPLSYMWNKHGRHIYDQPSDYFHAVSSLADLYITMLNDQTQLANLANDDHLVDFDAIKSDVENTFVTPIFVCVLVGKGQMLLFSELRFCVSRDEENDFSERECTHVPDDRQTVCSGKVFFPKSYQQFSYVYLSVYWFPSMLPRLRTYHNFNNEKVRSDPQLVNKLTLRSQWKVRGLCQFSHTPYILKRYYRQTVTDDIGFSDEEHSKRFSVKSPHIARTGAPGLYRYQHCGVPLRLANVPRAKGPISYYNYSVESFNQLRTIRWPPFGQDAYPNENHEQNVELASKFPMNQELQVADVKARLNHLVGRNVIIECFTNKAGAKILLKVLVCYRAVLDEFLRKDCPESETTFYRRKDAPYFPPEFKSKFKWPTDLADCGKGTLYIPSAGQNVEQLGQMELQNPQEREEVAPD